MTHLHSVIVSYKRRALTEKTLASYQDTVSVPHTLVIVDNGSPKSVTDWIKGTRVDHLLLGENRYPGYATNRGWELMPPETTLLQRIDNDTEYLPGWCDEMVAAFEDPEVGQYGPIADGDEPWASMPTWPVGGNSVIARRLYDKGLRYSELPWAPEQIQEDHQLTLDVWEMGYQRVFGTTPGIHYQTGGGAKYYAETRQARGLK
jgi:GT2 family glycosyltransferase